MTGIQADGLKRFCESISKQYYATNGRIKTEVIATRFRNFFELGDDVRLSDIIALCQILGIEKVIEKKLPGNMRGMFHNYNGQYTIHYDKSDWIGRQEHTLLHELYEIFETEVAQECSKFQKSEGYALEVRADKFASCVLMPKKEFLKDMKQYQYDACCLQQHYRRSYAAILIRMKSLLNKKTSFFGAIYENQYFTDPLIKYEETMELQQKNGHKVKTMQPCSI